MSCRCAPAAQAAAAAASALATFIRARPPNVAGIRWVYRIGIVRPAEAQDDQLALGRLARAERGAAAADVAVDPVVAVLALRRRHREVDDPAGAMAAHPGDERIVGVEDGRPRPRHGLDDDAP